MSKNIVTGSISVIWQYPIESTYKGLQLTLMPSNEMHIFKTYNPIVDFVNYKQFLIEKSSTLGISQVLFNQSLVDFLTLDEGKYRIAYFDGLERVSDSVLKSLSPDQAMSMFEYYIATDNIKNLKGIRSVYNRVMKKISKTA